MRKTKVQSKRFPRKLKKEIKQMFGERYRALLKSQQFITQHIEIAYWAGGRKETFVGWGIFFMIDDSFGEK